MQRCANESLLFATTFVNDIRDLYIRALMGHGLIMFVGPGTISFRANVVGKTAIVRTFFRPFQTNYFGQEDVVQFYVCNHYKIQQLFEVGRDAGCAETADHFGIRVEPRSMPIHRNAMCCAFRLSF